MKEPIEEDEEEYSEESMDDIMESVEEKSETLEILENMLNKENIEMKTDLSKPSKHASLKIFSKFMNSIGFEDSAELIDYFIETDMIYRVSKDRLGRKEIVDILSNQNNIQQLSTKAGNVNEETKEENL